jgi:hypothetical protein
MTTHVHDPSIEGDDPGRGGTTATGHHDAAFRRPGWLLPALAIGLLAIGLVVAGVVSLSTVLYAGAFGGMLLMHLGGHGHGAHGGGHGNDLSRGSGGSQQQRTGSGDELDDRAANQPNRNESHDDQHSSHGCH